jgi:cell division protein FtsW (lipid II flippase)
LDPALKMPSSKAAAEALINLASSLDGKGNDSVGQLVRQSLDANQNAYRAGQSLALLNNLYTVLFVHWLVTGALTCLLRCRISLFYRINAYLFLGLLTWVGFYYLGVTSNPLEAPYWLVAGCIIFVVNWCFHTFFLTKQPSQKLCRPFSHWVIPGWWFFTALGWLLILDQSLHFHSRNRFLVLEQWQAWWLAGLILPLSTLVSSPIAKGLLLIGSHWFQPGRRIQHIVSSLVGICLVLIMYVAHQLQIRQYVTGELLKLIFIFSVSTWCVWKMPSASSYWYANLKLQSLLQTLPCLLILVVVTAIAVVTRDKGPLLVIYIMAIILFSSLAGWTSGLVIIAFGFLLIFLIGPDLDVVGSRLQALRDPFSADHDDMARIIWFQSFAAEHPWGFGPGQVPWCGLASLDQCRGLPLQLQSDYTFTAIVGWWGLTGAMLFLIIFVLFCFHLLAHGARCNQVYIQPLSMCEQSVQVLAIKSALLFFSGSLMLLQVWITAAGNTGWLPLTGLTWPLVGFGKTSLWVTTWLIGSLSFDITDA